MRKAELSLSSEAVKEFVRQGEVPAFPYFAAGQWSLEGDRLEVRSPIDLGTAAVTARPSVQTALSILERVYSIGRRKIRETPGEERVEIFERTADALERMKEDLVNILMINAGKTRKAAEGEVAASIERLRLAKLDVRRIYGDFVPGDWSADTLETEAIVKKEPLGVVAAILPFNYPLFDAVNKIVYSAIAGNAVIVKPAEADPLPALALAKALVDSGFPPEALAVVPMRGRDMGEVLADRRVAAVSFTGSTETGLQVIKEAGVKQYVMELGGGDPAIVLSDADVKQTASKIVTGITSYSGQRCDSIKYILAEPEVYDELKEEVTEQLSKVRVGDPRDEGTDMGPLIDVRTADEVIEATKDAVSKGGKVLHGGEKVEELGPNYIKPTLIEVEASRLPDLYMYNKEVFASLAAIVKVNSLDEAIALANGRRYGLDAAIFGSDVSKIRKAARLLEVGAVYINDYPKHGIGYYPFGGMKDSGIGREGIGYTIDFVTAYKSIIYNYKGKGVWDYL
ncbi:NADP-dependent glyceraldehyde-3-phosphate dehydrogenase [Acidilobus saccharovorans]|nr:NADP-dependent glyceraldehyde-3-phosphate dehydrogenase [Acidilobus saccharovorans]